MEIAEINAILRRGEDSYNQFKENINNTDSLAEEFTAFSNAAGGKIFAGVDDEGSITGLNTDDVCRINQHVSNAASQHVRPAINPLTEQIEINGLLIIIINVPEGISKPYSNNKGEFWMKCGADKRKVTAREELQRIFQESGTIHADTIPIHADTIPVRGTTLSDLDMPYFRKSFQKIYEKPLNEETISLEQTITNMNLGKKGELNITGAMFFSLFPSSHLAAFIVKAAAFPGTEKTDESYLDKKDITGNLANIFQKTKAFVLSNIKHIQGNQGINSAGQTEIPGIVLEELIANALIHRDYFVQDSVKVFVFRDRIKIISPGHLPNNLTVDNIKAGISNMRNPTLASFANHILPCNGHGAGIPRALKKYPDIDFIDDRERNLFKCIIRRKSPSQ